MLNSRTTSGSKKVQSSAGLTNNRQNTHKSRYPSKKTDNATYSGAQSARKSVKVTSKSTVPKAYKHQIIKI